MADKYSISNTAQELIAIFKRSYQDKEIGGSKDEPKVKIHETIGKVAYAYEKVRNAVDYQEEHLLRKNAVGRMLKRRLLSKERGSVIAEPLIRELIRAGYLPNDYFPERRISDIERIISKYVSLIDLTVNQTNLTKKNKTLSWIISVASFEIEQYFSPTIRDDAMVEAMYKIIRPNIDLHNEFFNTEDQDIQVYIAMHRSLIKSDTAMLRYHLIHYYAPDWRYITPEEIPAFAAKLPHLMLRIDQQINNKLSDRLFTHMKKFAPLFTVLKDVLQQNPESAEQILDNPKLLAEKVNQACQKRYADASAKLSRGIIRSIIYILLTKTILAFVLELPYEAFVLKKIKLLPLAINVAFHPFLMFLIATSIRVPAEKNTHKITQGVYEIVYDLAEKEILAKREETFRGSRLMNALFSLFYFVAYFVTFGLIIWGLRLLEFSIVSGFLFMFFLSVISFFGLRLRNTAKELVILDKREGALVIVFDFFALPIIRVGRWISRKTSKVNIFMFILDFIIEAPFKVLIETVEDWVSFQRQKKDETF